MFCVSLELYVCMRVCMFKTTSHNIYDIFCQRTRKQIKTFFMCVFVL